MSDEEYDQRFKAITLKSDSGSEPDECREQNVEEANLQTSLISKDPNTAHSF